MSTTAFDRKQLANHLYNEILELSEATVEKLTPSYGSSVTKLLHLSYDQLNTIVQETLAVDKMDWYEIERFWLWFKVHRPTLLELMDMTWEDWHEVNADEIESDYKKLESTMGIDDSNDINLISNQITQPNTLIDDGTEKKNLLLSLREANEGSQVDRLLSIEEGESRLDESVDPIESLEDNMISNNAMVSNSLTDDGTKESSFFLSLREANEGSRVDRVLSIRAEESRIDESNDLIESSMKAKENVSSFNNHESIPANNAMVSNSLTDDGTREMNEGVPGPSNISENEDVAIPKELFSIETILQSLEGSNDIDLVYRNVICSISVFTILFPLFSSNNAGMTGDIMQIFQKFDGLGEMPQLENDNNSDVVPDEIHSRLDKIDKWCERTEAMITNLVQPTATSTATPTMPSDNMPEITSSNDACDDIKTNQSFQRHESYNSNSNIRMENKREINKLSSNLHDDDINSNEPFESYTRNSSTMKINNEYQVKKSSSIDDSPPFYSETTNTKDSELSSNSDGEGFLVSQVTTATEDTSIKGELNLDNYFNETETFMAHGSYVTALVLFQKNGKTLVASGSHDRTIKIWDAETLSSSPIATLETSSRVLSVVSYEMDGTPFMASAGDYNFDIEIWNLNKNVVEYSLVGHFNGVSTLHCFTKNEKLFLISSSGDKSIKMWDLSTRTCFLTFQGHTHYVMSLIVFELGTKSYLGSGSLDHTIKIWDIGDQNHITNLTGHTHYVNVVRTFTRMDNGHTYLISGSADNTIKIWNVTNVDHCKLTTTLDTHSDSIYSLKIFETISNQGKQTLLLSGSRDGTIKIWDLDDFNMLRSLIIPSGIAPWALATSHELYNVQNGEDLYLISGHDDGTIVLWTD